MGEMELEVSGDEFGADEWIIAVGAYDWILDCNTKLRGIL